MRILSCCTRFRCTRSNSNCAPAARFLKAKKKTLTRLHQDITCHADTIDTGVAVKSWNRSVPEMSRMSPKSGVVAKLFNMRRVGMRLSEFQKFGQNT